ncbi:hypothetical protein DL98DRAFT_648853 [Cadophora sp. DSE1049]|nr:hypothetical protein DL98DRAFT_648853 [Cadophora sp. DSE1049]
MVTTRIMAVQLANQHQVPVGLGPSTTPLNPRKELEEPEEKFQDQSQKFYLFHKLPLELRLQIWGYLIHDLSTGRIIDVFHATKKHRKGKAASSGFSTTAECPVAFRICNESKAEALKFSKCCALDIGTQGPLYFNPAVDAVFLRYLNLKNFPFPRLSKVRHLIVHYWIEPLHLAQYCPLLEDLTIVVHGHGHACRSQDTTKRIPLKMYKLERSCKIYCEYEFRKQDEAMDSFKLANPTWRKPILNALSATIEGKRCCRLNNYANPPYPQPRPVKLQNSTFWEKHCVPEPQF